MTPQTRSAIPITHTRRRVLTTLAAATPALASLACGQSATSGDSKSTQALKNVTIRVVARTAQEADMWPIRIPAFMQAYPTIKVEPELYPSDIVGKITAL